MLGSIPQYMDHLLISLLSTCGYFPIDSYAWIVSKSGLLICSFSDRMTLFDHMQIFFGNGNSPRLWLDAYHTPLIPIAPGFSWQCDLGRWRSLEPCFALVSKLSFIFNMQLCGFHCINGYSICILVIFAMYFIIYCDYHVFHREFLWLTVANCGQPVPTSTKWVLTLIFCVIVTRNGLNTKRSLHSSAYFTFLSILVNLLLTGNHMCHSQPKP